MEEIVAPARRRGRRGQEARVDPGAAAYRRTLQNATVRPAS